MKTIISALKQLFCRKKTFSGRAHDPEITFDGKSFWFYFLGRGEYPEELIYYMDSKSPYTATEVIGFDCRGKLRVRQSMSLAA